MILVVSVLICLISGLGCSRCSLAGMCGLMLFILSTTYAAHRENPEAAPAMFSTAYLCFSGNREHLAVEIADSPASRGQGMRGRTAVPEHAGMLFIYPEQQATSHGFWMYQVQFPLDIAFISADTKIVSITQMEPCLSSDPKSCPAYYSEKPYKSALEVNAGFFATAGIEVGDKVRYAVDGKCEHQ